MKTHFIPVLIVASLCFSCKYKDPNEPLQNLKQKLEEDQKSREKEIQDLIKNSILYKGGQPGAIKVSGALVKDPATLDSRITVVAKAGKSKTGDETPLASYAEPVFTTATGATDLHKLETAGTLLAIGCDQTKIADYASLNNLKIIDLPSPISKDDKGMFATAQIAVLCGTLEELKNKSLVMLNADEMVFDAVDFTVIGSFTSFIALTANKMTLLGENKIVTKMEPASVTISTPPYVNLMATKELKSEDNGKLLVMSLGADYIEKASQ